MPFVRLSAFVCIAVVALVYSQSAPVAGNCASAQRSGMAQARQAEGNITKGEFPPDFELPVLKFRNGKDGNPVGMIDTKKTIRLSSFRGEKPVCLIMSSYT